MLIIIYGLFLGFFININNEKTLNIILMNQTNERYNFTNITNISSSTEKNISK